MQYSKFLCTFVVEIMSVYTKRERLLVNDLTDVLRSGRGTRTLDLRIMNPTL